MPLRACRRLRELFEQTGLCFIYARLYHPVMKTVSRARVLADRRTIFNLAAPLSNPAMPAFQVVGTPMQTNAQLLAEILQRLGRTSRLSSPGNPASTRSRSPVPPRSWMYHNRTCLL
ncbi:MAG TPA: hypothetical protein DIC52_13335 [Candidatus Latescibacteria bacterium]|nr:hypothetical protein [Candidatus Latescibacterota bacterium]